MHTVAVLALPDTIAFDLSTPVEVFGRVQLASGAPGYRILVCGSEPVVTAGPFRIATDHGIDALGDADTIVVPGRNDVTVDTSDEVLAALTAAHARGTRIASICSGAFTLAATGLLDGRRATTHWLAADLFRTRFPAVHLDPDLLYVDEGQVLTSAGASAGLDLCLHMVARDYGSSVAADAARLAVAPLHRSGGQAQFIQRNQAAAKHIAERTELDGVLAWIEQEAHRDLMLRDIADRAAVSVRTLNRRFQAETGPDADAMADRSADPARPAAAREHGAWRRADRASGRVRLTGQLPRAVPKAHRGRTVELPQHFPRPHGGLKHCGDVSLSGRLINTRCASGICICSGAAANRCATPASSRSRNCGARASAPPPSSAVASVGNTDALTNAAHFAPKACASLSSWYCAQNRSSALNTSR